MNLQDYERTDLDNGLILTCSPMPAVRSVSIGIYLPVGSRYESAEMAGISHFLEHMAFKGCRGWPTSLDIANAIEGRGGYLNASTSYEFTSFWVKIGAGHWREGLALMANMVQRPLLSAVEMERERGVILDEIKMYRDVPEDFVGLLSGQAMWGSHPLGREIAGDEASVSALTVEALAGFHQRSYRPEGAVLTVAGAIDSDEVRAVTRSLFGDWRGAGESLSFEPAPTLPEQPRLAAQQRTCEQAHLQLAVPGLDRNHADRFKLSMLNAVLGDGMSSRLWQRLREEQGLTYSISSFTSQYADSGAFGVYGGCDAERVFEALEGIMAVCRNLQEQPVSHEELQRFKEYHRGRLELSSEDSGAVASWWGRQIAAGIEPLTLDQVLAEIDAVTAEGVQTLAGSLWQQQRLALAYVGPDDMQQQLTEWLG